MPRRQIRTADYSQHARDRLANAVIKAREAAGFKWRTDFARHANIRSIRSLVMLEQGEPGVGQTILFAVGRGLPNWDEDTPRVILEGGPVPPTTPVKPLADLGRPEAVRQALDIAREDGRDAGRRFMREWADAVIEAETERDSDHV